MIIPSGDPSFEPPVTRINGAATGVRYGVLGMLCLLSFILYLDRLCISQAVKAIEDDLQITHTAMSFVLASFTIAYGLFEIPIGHWADRHGSRGVLTRIVLWWSLFTVLTGAATGLVMLLIVRFLFGAGEAGALPNVARVMSRWFPANARGPAQGIVVTSALVGGAVAPVVTGYLIRALGWRWSFVMLGIPGILWAVVFYWWFRDDPAEHKATNELERRYIQAGAAQAALGEQHPSVPWRLVLASANVWLLGAIISCSAFTTYMFFSWYPTYLQEARAVTPLLSGWLASMVLAGGAIGCIMGGYLSDWLVSITENRRWSRCAIGFFSLSCAALAMTASIYCDSPLLAAAFTAWASLCVSVQQISWWAAVTEISGKHLGALFGLMNSLGVPGAAGSQLFLGRFVDWLGGLGYDGRVRWDSAFYLYSAVLFAGAVCWLFVDSTKSVSGPA